MSALPAEVESVDTLPSLIDRAASALMNARTAAEVLEARELAGQAYDQAKRLARLARAKGAHDELLARVHRAQADALEIEAAAKRRLADEYDAAQARGEVVGHGGDRSKVENSDLATTAQLGLTKQDIHESRRLRDAEKADPGVTKRILNERIDAGEEPSKAALRKGIVAASTQALRGGSGAGTSRKNPMHRPDPQSDVSTLVVGSCRRLLDGAKDYAPEFIIGGFHDDGDRARALAVMAECRDLLTDILETANVE